MNESTLGKYVKDSVTGLEGIVTSRTEYLNDSTRVCVERYGTDQTGKAFEPFYVPEARVCVVPEEQTPQAKLRAGLTDHTGPL